MRSIYWARSDLRIHDNLVLNKFCELSAMGLVVWCPTASYLRAEQNRKQFVDESLSVFSDQLKNHGLSLSIKNKKMPEVLQDLITKHKIDHIFWTKEFATEELNEENAVANICKQNGIVFTALDQNTLIHPSDLPFQIDNMPFVFTDFRKNVEQKLLISDLQFVCKSWPKAIFDESNVSVNNDKKSIFPAGELAGLERLDQYFWKTDSIQTYKKTRNGMLNQNDSSKFSAWLNLGCLSPRLIYQQLKQYESTIIVNDSTYWLFFELLWRDYFKFFSRKFGQKIFLEKGVAVSKKTNTNYDLVLFEKWCKGCTDEKFINANMNELNHTGWMSNRGRQNVASYLIHDLNLPWTWGAAYFEKKLIDYDSDLNWGNWLYLSGNGSDPRARKFNIEKQAAQYDPDGLYQKKWL